jgi:uncharacterized protein
MNNFNLQNQLTEDSVFIIGSVLGVKGKDITIKVNKDKNLPHLFYQGRTIRNVSVGLSNYVKILKGFTEIICKVEGEYLEQDKQQADKKYGNEKGKINRFLNISVFGFYDDKGKFQHGIKEMPLIGNECRLLSRNEFEVLHQLSDKDELSIKIGTLIDEPIQEIHLSAKKLFAGHIGIFGNTGSGKSNTLARMYTELFANSGLNDNFNTKSKFIFIDFNGEYSKDKDDEILTKNKIVYRLSTRPVPAGTDPVKYPISKSELEKLELLSILLDATEKTQQPFLHRAIDRDWFDKDNNENQKEIESITKKLKEILEKKHKDFNVPFLKKYIKDFEGIGFKVVNDGKDTDDLKFHGGDNCSFYIDGATKTYADTSPDSFVGDQGYLSVSVPSGLNDLQKIQCKILDQYYFEILNGYANQEHINPLMGRLKKRFDMLAKVFEIKGSTAVSDTDTKNIEVIDLKNVNLEIKKVIPLLICKSSYDEQKKKRDTDKENSLHIIIDEAHNILSENSTREQESWKDYRLETFEEIIKEGRKFGVFLTIASQRPSDISPTIISQLHNYFIHRLMNDNDLKSVNKAVSYLDKLSFDSISNLSTGCCFIAGQMTQFPLSVKVELLAPNLQPQSETVDLNKLWNKDTEHEN